MKNILIAAILLLTIISCEKEKLSNGHSDLIVVQGYLYMGEAIDSIRLSQAVLLNSADTLFHGITDATVTISCDGTAYTLVSSEKEGYYHCTDAGLKVSSGKTYTLDITYDNKHITSQTIVPDNPTGLKVSDAVLTVDPTSNMMMNHNDTTNSLTVSWSNPNKEYYFVVLENKDSTLITITFTNPFTGVTDTINSGNFARRFQSSPIQSSSYRISTNSVGNYGKYVFKLYKVTKDYANLYESRSQSSTNLNEPFSNINNGLGIFTSFSVDSISFRVVKKE
jgi:hypothetical protein